MKRRYSRIIDRVFNEAKEPERKIAAQLLSWIVCAKRPLKWQEIQGAVSIDLDTQTVDFDERRLSVDSKHLCGSLVEIRPGGVVDLVHLTAKLCVKYSLLTHFNDEIH